MPPAVLKAVEVLHREIFDRPLVAAEQSEGLARRGRLHVSDRVALAVEHAAEIDQTSGLERDGHCALTLEIDVGAQFVAGRREVYGVGRTGVDRLGHGVPVGRGADLPRIGGGAAALDFGRFGRIVVEIDLNRHRTVVGGIDALVDRNCHLIGFQRQLTRACRCSRCGPSRPKGRSRSCAR